MNSRIYIGSILLERNRWVPGKRPTYRVSEWDERFVAAGLDGVELWENHLLLAPPEEQRALMQMACPVKIYNVYFTFGDEQLAERRQAAEWIRRLGVEGVKYNLGKDLARRSIEMRNLRAWEEMLPPTCRLLCECHAGTILEEPAEARRFFDEAELQHNGIIVHCFGGDKERLREWLRLFGDEVCHVHVQTREEGERLERLRLLKEVGFRGTFTLEFTRGTGAPDENMEALFAEALKDLHFLRENW